MAFEPQLIGILQVKAQDIQPTAGGYSRVQLAQGTGSGIPRVGEQGLLFLFPQGVEPLESLKGHVHFAPHHQAGGIGSSTFSGIGGGWS